jgi:hypothetical protein
MYTELTAVDLSLPPAEPEPVVTHFEQLHPDPVEYFDTVVLDNALDFSPLSTSGQLFDFGLSELESCQQNPLASPWAILSPLSLPQSTGSPNL